MTSMAEYIELYSGIDHMIHYGYSTVVLIIYITFMFGFGIPILFPVAWLTFIILYRMEKYMMYFFYKVPPMYDEKITKEMLSVLRIAPVLYLLCGYWMITNQQLLSNDHLHPIFHENEKPETDHNITMIFTAHGWEGPYWPLGVTFIFTTLMYLFADTFNKRMKKYSKSFRIGSDLKMMEEGLDNYWCALSKDDKKWTFREETYRRDALGMQMMTDEQFMSLTSVYTNRKAR